MALVLGSDPEVFLKKNGTLVSAIGIVEGTKEHPLPLKTLGKGFFMQRDNVLLEYNTPPANSPSLWVEYQNMALAHLSAKMKEKGVDICISASEEMPETELLHPEAHVFGCEPDFNAWELKVNARPMCNNPLLRSAGGHVHIQFEGTNTDKILLVRKLDLFLGLWSVINDPDSRRRELYGKAGSFRFKPYGVEYRVMSNFWLKSPTFISTIWSLVKGAIAIKSNVSNDVQRCIDTGDVEMAKHLQRSVI